MKLIGKQEYTGGDMFRVTIKVTESSSDAIRRNLIKNGYEHEARKQKADLITEYYHKDGKQYVVGSILTIKDGKQAEFELRRIS